MMNEIPLGMKFELLPKEIIIECLEYLDPLDIFHSFDQLNSVFNKLIRTILLKVNLEYIRKRRFDRICTKLIINSEMKQQISSLHLSNKCTCGQIEVFLSFFSLIEFPNLRSLTLTNIEENDRILLKSMLPLLSQLSCFHLKGRSDDISDVLSILPMCKLQNLSIPTSNFCLTSTYEITSILKLTVDICYLDQLNDLFQYMPMLKYLHIKQFFFNKQQNTGLYMSSDHDALHLKRLIIDDLRFPFEYFKIFATQIPNLRSLTISHQFDSEQMISADEWEYFITSSLPYLNIFMFRFIIYYRSGLSNDIINMCQQFQNDFWQKQHHWHTTYVLDRTYAMIFTIPYCSDTYGICDYVCSYSDRSVIDLNVLDRVTNLTLHHNLSITQYPYYFSNVTSVTIEGRPPWCSPDCTFNEESVQYLRRIIHLSQMKHLNVSKFQIESPLLLNLVKESPQLSKLTVNTDLIKSFFRNDELCQYLSKTIKTLHITDRFDYSGMTKFFEIFSNLEELHCEFILMCDSHAWDFWLSLLNHSSQYSSITIWNIGTERVYGKEFFPRLEDEAVKRNLIYRIIPPNRDKLYTHTRLHIWIDEKNDCLSNRFI